MLVKPFKSLYERNHLEKSDYEEAISFLKMLEKKLNQISKGNTLEKMSLKDLDLLIEYLLENELSTVEHFIIMMRYAKVSHRNDLFIHLTKYTGSLGVMESIFNKLEKVVGSEQAQYIKSQLVIPKLGTPPSHMPQYTKKMVDLFQEQLTPIDMKKVLTDNHHQIPREAFIDEKIYYEDALTFDDYLKDLHERKIAVLTKHFEENKVWFEQEINEEVIQFVKSNQEILSAVRKDNWLYITKIPYDTKAYLEAKTDQEKRYHACHCPFVKEILINDDFNISPTWCNCSAGFTKYPFEVLFDRELDIICLKTPLQGDDLCRFRISLEGIDYKR